MRTILHINSVANIGSTGRLAEDLGRAAMKEGYQSVIAYGRAARPSASRLIRIGDGLDLWLHGLATRLFDLQGFASKAATRRLLRDLDGIRPDLVHLGNLHGYYIHVGMLFEYLKAAGLPVVWTLHDCWAMTGHCAHFSFVGCEKWQTLCGRCPQKGIYPASWVIDRSAENFRQKKELFTGIRRMTLVPVSRWLERIVRDSFLGAYPLQTIYNGVDVDEFAPRLDAEEWRNAHGLAGRFVVLGMAGSRWSERKGLDDFMLLSRRLDGDGVIVLAGLSARQVKKLPRGIIGLPRTESTRELSTLYSVADVFANLSVEESFGKTTVEAMACGTPSIVYAATAHPEIVSEETSLVVEPGNTDQLLQAIRAIARAGKGRYSQACRERAVRLFNNRDRLKDYLDLYRRMLLT